MKRDVFAGWIGYTLSLVLVTAVAVGLVAIGYGFTGWAIVAGIVVLGCVVVGVGIVTGTIHHDRELHRRPMNFYEKPPRR